MRPLQRFAAGCLFALSSAAACATPFLFSTGDPDGRLGTASRPGTAGTLEIESADDFILGAATEITHATFTGLLPSTATLTDIGSITVEIYRVFPADSDVGRTSGPPTFSTSEVPTRVNSPSDVEFADRTSASGQLTFNCSVLSPSFTVGNSVVNGINPLPNQNTSGEGAVTGQEVECALTFATPFVLAADHYFFVPQVELANGTFLWLSAPRPIIVPGTAFVPDLQSWIRNENLSPDWLRVGTDIVGGTTFNAAFSLSGALVAAVPEPGSLPLLLIALVSAVVLSHRVARAGRSTHR